MTEPNPAVPTDAISPVREIPGDQGRVPEPGLAVCLSGGGYRAMIFHVGVLWRLNELGLLPKVKRFSSVSGGSITAAVLAVNWKEAGFDDTTDVGKNFVDAVVRPLRRMADTHVDVAAVGIGVVSPFTTVSERVAAAYRQHLFDGERKTLQDLPDEPQFLFNSTNLATGVLMRFCKQYLADYKIGRIHNPTLELAVAVAASSAFPPVLSPCTIDLRDEVWVTEAGNDLKLDLSKYRGEVKVTDGGVYDNLGLETAWKNYTDILVSDAGGAFTYDPDPPSDWAQQTYRVLNVIDNQVRSLRKRQIVDSITAGSRKGTYVGIRSLIPQDFPSAVLPAKSTVTDRLAQIATRLDKLDAAEQEGLINWGYVVCDAGLRSYYMRKQLAGKPATALPYPGRPVS